MEFQQRPIEFRAWDIESKSMVSWDLLCVMMLGKEIRIPSCEKAKNFYLPVRCKWITKSGNPFTKSDLIKMQFTGLLDKNKSKIFEGDIVDCYDRSYKCGRGIVLYGQFMSSHEAGYSRHHLHQGFYVSGKDDGQIWNSDNEDIEWEQVVVVGNVFENPEFLKEA